MDMSPQIYKDDYSIYTDFVDDRHLRNIREFKDLVNLLKNNKISKKMLITNTINSYYPSYVLNHHFCTFLGIIQ